jgi:hypothetical protein
VGKVPVCVVTVVAGTPLLLGTTQLMPPSSAPLLELVPELLPPSVLPELEPELLPPSVLPELEPELPPLELPDALPLEAPELDPLDPLLLVPELPSLPPSSPPPLAGELELLQAIAMPSPPSTTTRDEMVGRFIYMSPFRPKVEGRNRPAIQVSPAGCPSGSAGRHRGRRRRSRSSGKRV